MQRFLKRACDDGHLNLVREGGGRANPNEYEFVFLKGDICDIGAPGKGDNGDAERVTSATRKGDIRASAPITNSSKTRLEHKDPPNPQSLDLVATAVDAGLTAPDQFDAFWMIYPRHVGKQLARKAWAKAIRTTDPNAVMAGAARFAADPNREDQFTPHPTTWLNRGGWDDDPLPARGGTQPKGDPMRRGGPSLGSRVAEIRRIEEQDRHPSLPEGAPNRGRRQLTT